MFQSEIFRKGFFIEIKDFIAEVTVDGRLYGEFPLYEDIVVDIDETLGNNTLVISDGQACISEADCPELFLGGEAYWKGLFFTLT